MEERLTELYQGVAVHATADREHMAALELLAVVMLADHHVGDDELDVLKELTEDWRGTAFSAARELVGVDDDVTPEEGTLLSEIAVRFG